MDKEVKNMKSGYNNYFMHKEMIWEKNSLVLKKSCLLYMGVLLFYTFFEFATEAPNIIINGRIESNDEMLLLLYIIFDIINALFIAAFFLGRKNNGSRGKVDAVYCTLFEVTLLMFFLIEGGCLHPDRVSMYIPIALILIVALFSHRVTYSIIMIVGYTLSFSVLVTIFKQPEIAGLDIQIAIATLFSALICYWIITSLRINEYDAIEKSVVASNSKSEFLSRMSHDLRTPMNAILGLSELSKDEYEVNTLRNNMAQIQTSGQYLLSIINEILDYQRIESGKLVLEPQVVSVQTLLDSILDIVRPSIEKKNIDLKVIKHDIDITGEVRIDPVRFKQVFINLLSNSIKFTPNGGMIEFAVEDVRREGRTSHAVISLTDNGIGMSEDFIKNKIFHSFSQENNSLTARYEGSGLGLSIVKKLVEVMGGTISVESELGVGTKFTISMDFERVDQQDEETLNDSDKIKMDEVMSALKGKHILVAEDHPLNAQIAKKLLEKVGCIVTWAKDGKECCQMFVESQVEQFDAILMDIHMPIIDGLEAAKIIRGKDRSDAKTVPIIAMTANAYEEDKRKSLSVGIDDHLAKPVNPFILYETLRKYI